MDVVYATKRARMIETGYTGIHQEHMKSSSDESVSESVRVLRCERVHE